MKQMVTIMQRISIIECIWLQEAAAGTLVEVCLNAKVAYSIVPGIRTSATTDVEPSRLRQCNAHKNDDNHMTC